MSLEVEEFPSLTNNNEDVSQTMESNSNQETNSDNEEEIEPLTVEINKKRIPPIIIDESVNTPALMDETCTLLGFKIMARMVGAGFNAKCPSKGVYQPLHMGWEIEFLLDGWKKRRWL
ncbi:hypothetical protein NPIL_684131 [Nephila pilipes]|uniref:Uncharacterized protein n=1 Tax=Nephila pilipes TaxID=299642 RepID=A0A8X6QI88_NEPPI|nr:hypothetical protein NPIL_684131 [Nephila pilipes]